MADLVAHYKIVRKLGAGGMGEVFLAEDTKLSRQVAIKFLRPTSDADAEQSGRRLLREARAAAILDHPNICAIHEVGEEGGRPFIVMQYVEGETLDRLIRKKPLTPEQAVAIGAEVADALSAAHARGLVHRDIKPSNIIVTPRGQAKVMDFGLASSAAGPLGADAQTESALSTPGAMIGTVPYMSPEQVRGEPADSRSDIFSLGVTLYEALSGHRPFAGENTAVTASAILTTEPALLTRYNPAIPDELQRIVRKCLEKDRERRYRTAADLHVDLQNLTRDSQSRPIASMGGPVAPRSARRAPRLLAVAAVVAALGVAGWYAVSQLGPAQAPPPTISAIAVLPFVNSNRDPNTEYLSDGITESIINAFSQLPRLRVMARTTSFRYKNKDVDPARAGRELGVDAVVTGKVLQLADTLAIQADLVRVSDGAQLWGERFDRKLADVLAVQDEIARQITEKLRLRLTGEEQQLVTKRFTDNTDAYNLFLRGRYFYGRTSEEGLDKSITFYQQAIAADPNYALAYVGLAQSYATLGGVFGFRSPRDAWPRVLEFAVKAVALDPKLGEAHVALAAYKLQYEWDWPGAEAELKQAITFNPNYGGAHTTYGSYYSSIGQLDRAMSERKIAQALDPLSPFATANVGYPYYYAKRYDEAIEHYRKAVELDPNYPWAHLWIGQAYVQKGLHQQALDAILECIRLSGGDTRTKATLGHAYAVAGRRGEALQVLDELKKASTSRYVSPYFLALIYVGLKDDDRALDALDAAYAERHPYLTFLKVEPVFERLRSHPRFIDLQRRVGLGDR